MDAWQSREQPRRARVYRCQCERAIFFRNSLCLGCGAALAYEPVLADIRALVPGSAEGTWRLSGDAAAPRDYRRCANFHSPAGCNWLVAADDAKPHCVACRLNRSIPDLSDADNRRYWRSIENAKRRLVAELIALQLPVKSKIEDPERGIAFDLLRSPPGGPAVMTGHGGGLITLNVVEADDAHREKLRHALHEPYRTLLGHFRHEIGHYYWDRLVAGTPWHERFRELFGDERADYAAALHANYETGPPANWADRYISAYASSHPWEDWAETWAHFLHLYDGLDTAMGFGFTGKNVTMEIEPYSLDDLYAPDDPDATRVLTLFNSWLALTTVLNEMARSLGQPDFYPFVTSRAVVRKLHFIHLVVKDAQSAAEIR
ncbi:MAG: putative zinc-binding metallopeptidase [Betaproteobacteria bacterium]